MDLDWMTLLNAGFLTFFAGFTLHLVGKHGPGALRAWGDFTSALKDLSTAVSKNTTITDKHYAETITVKDQLADLNRRLDEHDGNAVDIRTDQAEILRILREIQGKIKGGSL